MKLIANIQTQFVRGWAGGKECGRLFSEGAQGSSKYARDREQRRRNEIPKSIRPVRKIGQILGTLDGLLHPRE